MFRKWLILLLVAFVFATWCLAGTHDPFDGTVWDIASPDINQSIGNHYKEMYDLRKGVAIRMNKEHETLATSSAGGVHKQGSARAFFQDAVPGTRIDGSAFTAQDNGSLWFDTNSTPDNKFYFLLDYSNPTKDVGWIGVSVEVIEILLSLPRVFLDTLGVTGDFAVNTDKFTVAGATGNTIVAGTLGVAGDFAVNTNKFTVAGATGNTVVAGTLGVTGIATLGDGSLATTQSAADNSTQLATTAYADRKEAILVTQATASIFGTRTANDTAPATLVKSTIYRAACDGFITVSIRTNDNTLDIYVEASDTSPDVKVATVQTGASIWDSVTVPVAKDEYLTVTQTAGTGNPTIYWIPIGTGGLVDQT